MRSPTRAASIAALITFFGSVILVGVIAALLPNVNHNALGQEMGRAGCFLAVVVGIAVWVVQTVRIRRAGGRPN